MKEEKEGMFEGIDWPLLSNPRNRFPEKTSHIHLSPLAGPVKALLSDITAFQFHGSGTSLLAPHQATSSPPMGIGGDCCIKQNILLH